MNIPGLLRELPGPRPLYRVVGVTLSRDGRFARKPARFPITRMDCDPTYFNPTKCWCRLDA